MKVATRFLALMVLLAGSLAISTPVSAYQTLGPYNFDLTPTDGDFILSGTGLATDTHKASFQFRSRGYLTLNNIGHIAIGVRAGVTPTALHGSGIVIGNVTLLPNNPPCGPTSQPAAIAIEEFDGDNSCVLGPSTESPALQDNQWYKVVIISNLSHSAFGEPATYLIHYQLLKLSAGSWTSVYNSGLIESDNNSDRTLAGFFMTEVFSTHQWTFEIRNLLLRKCGQNEVCPNP